MRRRLLSLLLVALAIPASVGMAEFEPDEEVGDDLLVEDEETLEPTDETDAQPMPEVDPRLTPDVIEMILSKSSAKCRKQVQENPTDVSKLSDRCRAEMSSRVQRYLARLDKEESGEAEEKKEALKKKRSRKSKKKTRAQRVAAAAQKREEEYQKTLQTIVGFVVTLVVIIATAMFFINRKLKDAGLYFSDPDAKATCCN